MKLIDIAKYPIEEIQKEIEALEAEMDKDTSLAKKTYAANCIRLDIARLQRDVNIIANEMFRFTEAFEKICVIADEQVRLANAQDVMCSSLSSEIRILKTLAKKTDDVKQELEKVKDWIKRKFGKKE